MRRSRNFCQRGSNFCNVFFFFLVDGRRDDQNTTKRPLNGVSLASRWWPIIEFWPSIFASFQGILTSIAKKAYFSDLSGGTGPPVPPPSESAHASQTIFSHVGTFARLDQYLIEYNVSCTRKQYGASRKTQTNSPFISRLALYHWLTLQILYSYLVTVSPRGMRCPGLI